MEKEQLRKADLLTSLIIFVFGLFVVIEALGMPMADSYGGVQNVWYVSPALLPLLVGGCISLLGLGLFKIALTAVGGPSKIVPSIKSLFDGSDGEGILSVPNFRFLTIVILFVCYVYIYIPRVDFFLCSLLFLFTFINMFHLEDTKILAKLLGMWVLGALIHVVFFALGLQDIFADIDGIHAADFLTIAWLVVMVVFTWLQVRHDEKLRRRFKNGTIVAFTSPFILGPVFKFFLLVPLPYEGIVVYFMEYMRYDVLDPILQGLSAVQ